MKPDLYTKAVLTVIAVALSAITCNQYISPAVTAQAQGTFAGVQALSSTSFFDTRTGEVFVYEGYGYGKPVRLASKLRLTKLGQPLQDEFEAK